MAKFILFRMAAKSNLKLVVSNDEVAVDVFPPSSTAPLRKVIIRGVTRDGRKFRPSDWAERLYYAVASYGHNRAVTFNPLVHLKMSDGVKCLVLDIELQDKDPMLFDFLVGFARDNELVLLDQDRNVVTIS